MGRNKYKKKTGGSAGFSSTPTSKYHAPTAGYEDEIFEFGDQGAAKFDRTLYATACHILTYETLAKDSLCWKQFAQMFRDS